LNAENTMPKTTWKKWRVGLLLTIALGFLSGCAGLAAGMSWQAFAAVVATSLVTHVTAYLQKSPLEDVEDNSDLTKTIEKFGQGPNPPNTP